MPHAKARAAWTSVRLGRKLRSHWSTLSTYPIVCLSAMAHPAGLGDTTPDLNSIRFIRLPAGHGPFCGPAPTPCHDGVGAGATSLPLARHCERIRAVPVPSLDASTWKAWWPVYWLGNSP